MLYALLFAAEEQAKEAPSGFSFLVPLIPIFFLFYFLMIRPAQKQEQQRRALVSSVKKNDKIVNSGGIIGIVDSIKEKEDEVVLKGGLRITKSSIVRLVAPDEPVKEQ